MGKKIILSTLPKTWVFDLDGTLLKHNGYKLDGTDTVLFGVKEYLETIPKEDRIVIFTSRTEEYRQMTLDFLHEHQIRYDEILFNMPMGERIIVNDRKPYVDAQAGRNALEMILAIYKSQKTGLPVKLPLEDFASVDMKGMFS